MGTADPGTVSCRWLNIRCPCQGGEEEAKGEGDEEDDLMTFGWALVFALVNRLLGCGYLLVIVLQSNRGVTAARGSIVEQTVRVVMAWVSYSTRVASFFPQQRISRESLMDAHGTTIIHRHHHWTPSLDLET